MIIEMAYNGKSFVDEHAQNQLFDKKAAYVGV